MEKEGMKATTKRQPRKLRKRQYQEKYQKQFKGAMAWLRVASSVAKERLLAEGIRRAQEFMAVDPHALDQKLNWNPPRPVKARAIGKPPLESADDILGD